MNIYNKKIPSRHNGYHVLLVDDMASNQIVGMQMLTKLGVMVEIAKDGQQAIDAVSKNHYDLVLMDCQMPVMDGYAATKVIRAQEQAPGSRHIPIIALTAHAMQGDREACLAAGMDDYLSKPYMRADLEAMLAHWLPGMPATPATEENSEVAVAAITSVELIPVKAMTNGSLFDSNKLDELRQLTGNNVQILFNAFKNDADVVMPQLIAAVTEQNIDDVRKSAHALKGASAGVGAMSLSSLCLELETQARNGQVETLSQQVEMIKMVYESTLEAIKKM